MKYELSNNQVKTLLSILSNANIKGSDAPIIIELATALGNPIKETFQPVEPKKKEKNENN